MPKYGETSPHGVSSAVTRSANPHPVCRKGHCSFLAETDSEWCTGHGAEVEAARQTVAERRAAEVTARKLITARRGRRV